MKCKPRILPRDPVDVLVGAPIGVIQAAVVLGVPSVLVGIAINPVAGAITYLALAGASFLFVVNSLEVQADGVIFRRVLGTPKRLVRANILSVEEASRSEVFVHGWLWPPWPAAREMTMCMSAKGHFRFRWKGGCCYFPPKDREPFMRAIEEMMAGNPTTPSIATK